MCEKRVDPELEPKLGLQTACCYYCGYSWLVCVYVSVGKNVTLRYSESLKRYMDIWKEQGVKGE